MSEFKDLLRSEIHRAQDRRGALVRSKLAYVIAAFGLGSIATEALPTSPLMFLAPVIAFVFDLYIAGENFRIKRAGGFLGRGRPDATAEEAEWELRVDRHRNPFSRVANLSLSVIVLLASAAILWSEYGRRPYYFVWAALNLCLILSVAAASRIADQRVRAFREPLDGEHPAADQS